MTKPTFEVAPRGSEEHGEKIREAMLMSEEDRYRLAIRAYKECVKANPDLAQEPGVVADEINRSTGVEFAICSIVALSPLIED